jgi:DNA helicase HerA-like ATPase
MKQPAFFAAVIGATGSGKTTWIRQQIAKKKPRRLIVWDPKPKSDYAGAGQAFSDLAELADAMLKAGARGELRAIFRPGQAMSAYKTQFDRLCRLVYAWKNCTFIAEELAHTTKSGWSPDGWLAVVTLGRSENLSVYGATQRPALVDKTFLSAATLIHCGRLGTRSDRVTMADMLDCSPDDLVKLTPGEWIERRDTGETSRGNVFR